MKTKIFLVSFSVIFAIAMQLTKREQTNTVQSSQYATEANQTSSGGLTTDDLMSRDSLSTDVSLNYYTYHLNTGNKAGNEKSILQILGDGSNGFIATGNQKSFKLPFNVYVRDPYDACVISPANCVNDMAGFTIPFDSIRKSAALSYAKPGVYPIPNYHDVKYKDDILVPNDDDFFISEDELKGCAFKRDTCETDSSALNYIVYSPINVDYSNCKLPGIILFHAGGYSDCSNYNYEDKLCYALARKGFIVYLVEYRRGRIKDPITNGQLSFTSAQQMLALYRAFQDGRGAIRSIIKRQRNILSNNLPYQVDTSNIFVAGQSAGASIANSLAYYNTPAKIAAIFPVPTGEITMEQALGSIDEDFYFGTPDIEYQSKIKGLWSMWGGFGIPTVNGVSVNAYNFLSTDLDVVVPMIGVMGKKDPVFPIPSSMQYRFYPKNDINHINYISQSLCLISSPFKAYNNTLPYYADFRVECVNDIYNIFKAHGIATLLYLDCKMGHGLAHVAGDSICTTDFGAYGDTTTLNGVNEYLAARACFFFQSILNGKVDSLQGTSKFTDCQDYRHSDGSGACAIAEHDDNCYDAKTCN